MAGISDINWLFNKYYGDNLELKGIVMTHSEQVARKALDICKNRRLSLNPKEVYVAALLHDIGVVKCKAPDIFAFGSLPYIMHGIEGRKILEENGLFKFAGVCSNHTGAGITAKEIRNNNIPLPQKNYKPTNQLERLICYADKFFSKSRDLKREKTLQEVTAQMKKFGQDSLNRFMLMHKEFNP